MRRSRFVHAVTTAPLSNIHGHLVQNERSRKYSRRQVVAVNILVSWSQCRRTDPMISITTIASVAGAWS
jgi:hypothetical protein